MLKKAITYENFNGETVTEEYFFHLSKAEMLELEMSREGGLSASLQRIVDAKDNKSLIAEFKMIILKSYGKKSGDGTRFIKNDHVREEFVSSEAYSALFWELATETDAAIEFINGIIPPDMPREVEQLTLPDERQQTNGNTQDVRIVTRAEFQEMSPEAYEELKKELSEGKARID